MSCTPDKNYFPRNLRISLLHTNAVERDSNPVERETLPHPTGQPTSATKVDTVVKAPQKPVVTASVRTEAQ